MFGKVNAFEWPPVLSRYAANAWSGSEMRRINCSTSYPGLHLLLI